MQHASSVREFWTEGSRRTDFHQQEIPPGGRSEIKNILQLKLGNGAVLLEPIEVELFLVAHDGDEIRPSLEMLFLEPNDLVEVEQLDLRETFLARIDRCFQSLPRTHGADDLPEPDLARAITA